jgi:hypothetical protein
MSDGAASLGRGREEVEALDSSIRAALLTALRERLGEDPISRSALVTHFLPLQRAFDQVHSPDQNIISNPDYRALVSVQVETLFVELYLAGRD